MPATLNTRPLRGLNVARQLILEPKNKHNKHVIE